VDSEGIGMLRAQMWELKLAAENAESKRSQVFGELLEKLGDVACEIKGLQNDHASNKPTPLDIDMIAARIVELCSEGRRSRRVYAVLSALTFEQRPLRHGSIPDAHQKTFEWAFKDMEMVGGESSPTDSTSLTSVIDPDAKAQASQLVQWLKHGSGTFWISGKPGSGKSTLMKFLTHPDRPTMLSRSGRVTRTS